VSLSMLNKLPHLLDCDFKQDIFSVMRTKLHWLIAYFV
jgi:hypothetical protein